MFITLSAAWGNRSMLVNVRNISTVYENTVEGKEVVTVKMIGGERSDVKESFGEIKSMLDDLVEIENYKREGKSHG